MTFEATDSIINSQLIVSKFDDFIPVIESGDFTEQEWDDHIALADLIDFCEKQNSDWNYGVPLINESYFVEYIKDMMIDCNHEEFANMPKIIKDNIDWNGVADDCKADYSEVEFLGQTFYILCI